LLFERWLFLNEHNLHNDSHPEPGRFGIAQFFTGNAILVHQILSGNFKRLTVGTQISTQGMSAEQISLLRGKLDAAGFELNSNGDTTYMYSLSKKVTTSK